MGFCNCPMFCCTYLYVPSSFAIILMGRRELVALLSLSSWCLFVCDCCVANPRGAMGLFAVIVLFLDHYHLLFSGRVHLNLKFLTCVLLICIINHQFVVSKTWENLKLVYEG